MRPVNDTGRYHVAGTTAHGPTREVRRVTSMGDYRFYYGDRTEVSATLHDDVALFLAEGGREVYITRVVGPFATRGEATLLDQTGTPTIRLTMRDPGPHSATISAEATPTGTGFDLDIYEDRVLLYRWRGIPTPIALAELLDDHPFLTATNLPTDTTAPLNNPTGTALFTTGDDDVDDLTPADYVTALDETSQHTRGAAVAVPALDVTAVGELLADHAALHQKTAILFGGRDVGSEELADQAHLLRTHDTGDHVGVFWPWVTTSYGHQPPAGYVAAARSRVHRLTGYWEVPVGPLTTSRTLTGLRFPNTPDRNEEHGERLVSALVTDYDGIQLHGWWSLSPDRANFPHLGVRDLLNNIAVDLTLAYSRVASGRWNTLPKLVSQIHAATKSTLATLTSRGALIPHTSETGFKYDNGYRFTVALAEIQPPDRNAVTVNVAVRPERIANLVGVRVFRVPLDTPLEHHP